MSILLKVVDKDNKGPVGFYFWGMAWARLWWCPLFWPIGLSAFAVLGVLFLIGLFENEKN